MQLLASQDFRRTWSNFLSSMKALARGLLPVEMTLRSGSRLRRPIADTWPVFCFTKQQFPLARINDE
jgi:hypothetical protein